MSNSNKMATNIYGFNTDISSNENDNDDGQMDQEVDERYENEINDEEDDGEENDNDEEIDVNGENNQDAQKRKISLNDSHSKQKRI